MLKSIATVSSVHTTKQTTTETRLFLNRLTFLAMIKMRSERRLKKQLFIFVKTIVLTKNWFAVNIIYEFP